jgi:Tat protein secretion system quality control protein TatD with DNase activity
MSGAPNPEAQEEVFEELVTLAQHTDWPLLRRVITQSVGFEEIIESVTA